MGRTTRAAPSGNGPIEATNSKTRLPTRMAFGFKNPQALFAPAMLALASFDGKGTEATPRWPESKVPVRNGLLRRASDIPVHGMLCFIEADWPLFGGAFTIFGVDVPRPKNAADTHSSWATGRRADRS